MLYSGSLLVIYFTYSSVCISIPFSQFIPPAPFLPGNQTFAFYIYDSISVNLNNYSEARMWKFLVWSQEVLSGHRGTSIPLSWDWWTWVISTQSPGAPALDAWRWTHSWGDTGTLNMQGAEKFLDVWALNNAYKKKLNRNKVAVLTVNYHTLNCVPANLHVEALSTCVVVVPHLKVRPLGSN